MEYAVLVPLVLGALLVWVGLDHLMGGDRSRSMVNLKGLVVNQPSPRAPRVDLLIVAAGAVLVVTGIAIATLT